MLALRSERQSPESKDYPNPRSASRPPTPTLDQPAVLLSDCLRFQRRPNCLEPQESARWFPSHCVNPLAPMATFWKQSPTGFLNNRTNYISIYWHRCICLLILLPLVSFRSNLLLMHLNVYYTGGRVRGSLRSYVQCIQYISLARWTCLVKATPTFWCISLENQVQTPSVKCQVSREPFTSLPPGCLALQREPQRWWHCRLCIIASCRTPSEDNDDDDDDDAGKNWLRPQLPN